MRITATAFLIAVLTGCTWVELTEDAKTVSVVSSVDDSCKRLGSSVATTKADIARIDRSSKKVGTELETIARNAAARMGGDTISAESEISEAGEQTFGIYRCGA